MFTTVFLLTLFFSNVVLAQVDEEFLTYCVGEVFLRKYQDAQCWSCDIIKILIRTMMDLTSQLYEKIIDLCYLILQLGGIIWLAVYFLKSLSSLTAQDPAKVIDGAIMFIFKWAFVYAILVGGMDIIMGYIVNPLLSIGFDIGMSLTSNSGLRSF